MPNLIDYALIPLTQDKVAVIDLNRLPAISKFKWRAVKAQHNYYAKANVKKYDRTFTISMHRFIARTPFGMVCHHINQNSLDNRLINLVNMTKQEHERIHANNRITVKFERTPTILL